MQDKIEHLKKLLTHQGQKTFVVPNGPGSSDVEHKVITNMKHPEKTVDKDEITISFCLDKPTVIHVHTCLISGHNGDEYDRYDEEIPIFESFLDFAIDVERNRIHGDIAREIAEEERKHLADLATARMRELGL